MRRILMILPAMVLTAILMCAQTPEEPDSVAAMPSVVVRDSVAADRTDTLQRALPALPKPTSTPVDIDDDKPVVVLHYYDKHGDALKEPVLFLATLDTVKTVRSGPVYPLYNGVNVGINFGDAIMMAFGQRYASFDVHANVSLWNWLFPTVEMGLGFSNDTPDHQNYTYYVSPSFYAKIGANYNFLYKSNPAYQFFLGIRAGFSHFKYSLRDVSITSDFWDESQKFSIEGLKSTAFYGEALAGLQVKIVGGFSLGWDIRWHFMFHSSKDGENQPWFIPGYGASNPFTFTASAIWTFGPKAPPKEE